MSSPTRSLTTLPVATLRMTNPENGPDEDDDYLAGLPAEIVGKAGHLWTTEERDTILELMFDPFARVGERRMEPR